MSHRIRIAVGLIAAATAIAVPLTVEAAAGAASLKTKALPTVTVGIQPALPFAAVPLGVKRGLFKKYGLNVKVDLIDTASTIPPALLAGSLQFSDWSFPSFTALASAHLPLKVVGYGDTAGTNSATDYTKLVTLQSSGITTVKDLAGKTVAVNSLSSLSQVQVLNALSKAGVDPSSVTLVPIPYADQVEALSSGQVSAIGSVEPYLTQVEATEKVNLLANLDVDLMRNLPVSLYMTSEAYVQRHRTIVRDFQLGLAASLNYAQSHSAVVRAFLPSFTGVTQAVASKVVLPTWTTHVNLNKVAIEASIMYKYGIIDNPVAMAPYILQFPLPVK